MRLKTVIVVCSVLLFLMTALASAQPPLGKLYDVFYWQNLGIGDAFPAPLGGGVAPGELCIRFVGGGGSKNSGRVIDEIFGLRGRWERVPTEDGTLVFNWRLTGVPDATDFEYPFGRTGRLECRHNTIERRGLSSSIGGTCYFRSQGAPNTNVALQGVVNEPGGFCDVPRVAGREAPRGFSAPSDP